jgi:hypothetical protein
MNKRIQQITGIILITIGIFFFILIGGLSIWSDLEASLFNSAMRSSEPLSSLTCPSIISSEEIGVVSAEFTNTSDRLIHPKIQTFVSDGFVILMQEKVDRLEIEPGETKSVEVKVSSENAVYNRIILVRMHQFPYGPLPYRNASCGIYVINIPFLTGQQFIIISLVLGLIFSGVGLLLWALSSRPIVWDKLTRIHELLALILLAIFICITGLSSMWLLGVFLLVLWFLLGIGLIGQAVMASENKKKKSE